MPGVLICEALAQAGGLLACCSTDGVPEGRGVVLAGLEHVRFRRPVVPGDQLRLEVELLHKRRPLWKMKGQATRRRQGGRGGRISDHGGRQPRSWACERRRSIPRPSSRPARDLGDGVEVGPYAVIGGRGARSAPERGSALMRSSKAARPSVATTASSSSPRSARSLRISSIDGEPTRCHRRREPDPRVRDPAHRHRGRRGRDVDRHRNLFMNFSHVAHDCTIGDRVSSPTARRSPAT